MIRIALLALAVFFCLSCRQKPASTDAGAVPAPSADGGATAPVVVDPAAPAPAAPGPDGGTAVVMSEAKVKIDTPSTPPAASADVKPVPAPMAP